MTEKAEKFNGKAAMLGMFALVGAYYFTGQIVPGVFQFKIFKKTFGAYQAPFLLLNFIEKFLGKVKANNQYNKN